MKCVEEGRKWKRKENMSLQIKTMGKKHHSICVLMQWYPQMAWGAKKHKIQSDEPKKYPKYFAHIERTSLKCELFGRSFNRLRMENFPFFVIQG